MIKTERLVLRRAREDDLLAMHAVLSDARAMHYWATPPYTELAQTESWLAEMIAACPSESEDYVIEHEGRAIGKIGAYKLPWFGYFLHPDHWGKGLAREAMAAFLGAVARRGDVDELHADIDPRNTPSIRLVERFGFRENGRAKNTWETHLGWCDSVYYAIDREGMARWG